MDDASLSANRDALRSLIDRLESAESGSRELDAAINAVKQGRGDIPRQFAPSYTVSIDAALTLVPEGCRWRVGHTTFFPRDKARLWASVAPCRPGPIVVQGATAPTPALALCIAALRARFAVSEEEALSASESVASQ